MNEPNDPGSLDAAERIIADKMASGDVKGAAEVYCDKLPYPLVGRWLADYRRGLRASGLFNDADGMVMGPEWQSPTFEHGLYLFLLGRAREAFVRFEAVLDNLSDSDPLYLQQFRVSVLHQAMVDALIVLGRLPEAEELSSRVIDENQDDSKTFWYRFPLTFRSNWDPFSRRALARFNNGAVSDAMKDFSAAIQRFPSERIAFQQLLLGSCLVRLGQIEAANGILRRSRSVAGGWQELPLFQAYQDCLEAEILMSERREREAMPHAHRVKAWASKAGHLTLETASRTIQARCLLREGSEMMAVEILDDVLERSQHHGHRLRHIDGLVLLSHASRQRGDLIGAIDHASKAREEARDPNCAYAWGLGDAYHALALAYEDAGNIAQARGAIDGACEVRASLTDPRVTGSVEVRERLSSPL